MDGVLIIDKPSGMTSHDVVAIVRRALGTKKVGHGGTLDPNATGVLVMGVGNATRLLSYAQGDSKRYTARVRFGASTTTQDASGQVIESRPAAITRDEVERELKAFRGHIEQIPPMVSAVKIDGERLYRKALRGETVERPPRAITIYSLEVIDFEDSGTTPEAVLDVACSGGTYIRTLAHDLGERLGCGAHLATLRRTESGAFALDEAVTLEGVNAEKLLPPLEAVRGLVKIEVDADAASAIADGKKLDGIESGDTSGPFAMVHQGELLAIYRRDGQRLVADKVIPR